MLNFFIPANSAFFTLAALRWCRAAGALRYYAGRVSPGRGSWPVDLGP